MLDYDKEIRNKSEIRDIRTVGQRMAAFLRDAESAAMLVGGMAGAAFFLNSFAEAFLLVAAGLAYASWFIQTRHGLPLAMPKSAGVIDPMEINLKTGKPTKSEGIVYLGNDMKTGEEVWLTDTMARTHMMFLGTTGSGKAQPLDARVHTPSGWKRMGDIQVGDAVSIPSGGSATVSGVFPQGEKDIFRISFADGRSTEACGEHLWEVHHKHWNGKYKKGVSRAGAAKPRILTTTELASLKARNTGHFYVRLVKPVEQERKNLPLNPYLLGVLLGDGNFSGRPVRFSSDDREIVAAVADAIPHGMQIKNYPHCQSERDYHINGPRGRNPDGSYRKNELKIILGALGLHGLTSERKFVPDLYLSGSVEQRLSLLRGLMDTDGYGGQGSTSFTTVSYQLAKDVQYLVRSLGGIAKISEKVPKYNYKGEQKTGRVAYTINIRHPDPAGLFGLERKKASGYQYSDSLKLEVTAIEPAGKKPCQCILVDHPDHLYITDDFIVTHNTELLLSTVFNALIHGSGLIYVDGKAEAKLYGKIYSMARAMGREDDVLVINFQTGAHDIFGPQPFKMSNSMNPFSIGSSGMISELVKGLMASGKDGKSDVWENRAFSFVEGLIKPLVFLRDNYGLLLDVNVIREYFDLKKIEELVWRGPDKYPGLGKKENGLEVGPIAGLLSYLKNLPAYDERPQKIGNQGETTNEQHGYITMQLVRTFNSLSDTYGYIMRTPLPEIDFTDVFLNRRILVVLLPALEKAPAELSNLGRIIVASIKATMAKGLGAQIEGEWSKIIDSSPTKAPSPFMCVLDEYGYYAVEGFAVVPAQARSLGFSAIFAGQDLPAFEKSSKEEAKSTLANTNTKGCGKLICGDTADYFKKLAGQGTYSRTGGHQYKQGAFSNTYMDMNTASIEKYDRVTQEDLMGQLSGQWHIFFANRIVRMKSFYANPDNVSSLRVNHFIRVKRPDAQKKTAYLAAIKHWNKVAEGDQPVSVDLVPLRDIDTIAGFMRSASGMSALPQAISSIVSYINATQREFNEFEMMIGHESSILEAGDDPVHSPLPVADSVSPEDLRRENFDDEFIDEADSFSMESYEESPLPIRSRELMMPVTDSGTMESMRIYGMEEGGSEGQGVLNRDRVENDIERIERRLGMPPQDAAHLASSMTTDLGEATRYARVTPNNGKPNEEDYLRRMAGMMEEIARAASEKGEEK